MIKYEAGEALTPFGKILSEASRTRNANFKTDTSTWKSEYQQNADKISRLRSALALKGSVIIAGAGKQPGIDQIVRQTKGWLYTGVQWTNFNQQLNVDIITSTHTTPLEAALYSNRIPQLLIHGVYSKVPPVLRKSLTIRWADPFLTLGDGSQPSQQYIEALIKNKAIGVAPFLPAVRNSLFLNAMMMVWLGAKRIVFTAVDPLNPAYFFTGNKDIVLSIMRAIMSADPWLAEWDGRNERLGLLKRSTAHRVQTFAKNILCETSAVGGKEYIFEFDRGFDLLCKIAAGRGIDLGYAGASDYMKTTGIARIL